MELVYSGMFFLPFETLRAYIIQKIRHIMFLLSMEGSVL
jgi:hypothetical protein